MEQQIDRPYKASELHWQFVYNYNIMAMILMVPLVIALICKIKSKKAENDEQQ